MPKSPPLGDSPAGLLRMLLLHRAAIVLAVILGLVALTEWYLGRATRSGTSDQPVYRHLARAHSPYSKKIPDTTYGFFLPRPEPDARGLRNGAVHLSPDGFRGPGPRDRDGRALAFLVGNSVVFGFAEHDSLTISGILNRIQDEFFFVNAGVPSWASSQIRLRIVHELLLYDPGLIVFWGGYNDASLAYAAAGDGQSFDPDRIDRAPESNAHSLRLLTSLVPHLMHRLQLLTRSSPGPRREVDAGVALAAATAFLANVRAAQNAVLDAGVRFLAVYQPVLYHHKNHVAASAGSNRRVFFNRFRDTILERADTLRIPMLDLGDHFDKHFQSIPVFTPGRGPDLSNQVFVDIVHLYVPGNRLVACAIARRIGSAASRAPKPPF